MKLPSLSKITTRLLPRSPTKMRSWLSIAIACGERNCPSPVPRVANVLMKRPSLVNFMMRELSSAIPPWPSATKISPLLAATTPVGASNVSRPLRPFAFARLAELQEHAAIGAELRHLETLCRPWPAHPPPRYCRRLSTVTLCGSMNRPAPKFFIVRP